MKINNRIKLALVAMIGMFAAQEAGAAFLTTPDLSPYFGAANFGDGALTVTYLPAIYITNTSLNNITTGAQQTALFALAGTTQQGYQVGQPNTGMVAIPNFSNIDDVFYVDTLSACGTQVSDPDNSTIVGCATVPGNTAVVPSAFMATANGAEDLAHEIGHNFGLLHCEDPANAVGAGGPGCAANDLMTASGFGNPNLNAAQVAIINNSALLAEATTLNIQPIVMVPVPAAAWLFTSGLGLLGMAGRRASGKVRCGTA